MQTQPDASLVEQPIRFLSGTFAGAQTRWSTIEKEAYAIYWALKKLDDLLGGIRFTIQTDHRNLFYLNNHGSRKILQWKLDIHTMMLKSSISLARKIPGRYFQPSGLKTNQRDT